MTTQEMRNANELLLNKVTEGMTSIEVNKMFTDIYEELKANRDDICESYLRGFLETKYEVAMLHI